MADDVNARIDRLIDTVRVTRYRRDQLRHSRGIDTDPINHQQHIVERVYSERGPIRRIAVAVLLDQFGRPRRTS